MLVSTCHLCNSHYLPSQVTTVTVVKQSPLGLFPKAPATYIERGENLAINCIKVPRFYGVLRPFKPLWFLSRGLSFPEHSLSLIDPSGLRLCRQLILLLSPEEERVVCSQAVESLFRCSSQLEYSVLPFFSHWRLSFTCQVQEKAISRE